MSKRTKKKKDKQITDAELLSSLATLDDVTAYIPTAHDHLHGIYPQWCELSLQMRRQPEKGSDGPGVVGVELYLRRHDGELIMEVLDEVLHPNRGGGSADQMWSDLDDCMNRIMHRVNKDKSPHDEDRGEAVGVTKALARLVLPHENFEDAQAAIRDIAVERYQIRNGHRNGG